MNTALASVAVSRMVVVAIVAALLQLGPALTRAHADDGCKDETCNSLQCDMATGSGCASPCGHIVAVPASVKPAAASAVCNPVPTDSPHHNLRLKSQPFRPPIVA